MLITEENEDCNDEMGVQVFVEQATKVENLIDINGRTLIISRIYIRPLKKKNEQSKHYSLE